MSDSYAEAEPRARATIVERVRGPLAKPVVHASKRFRPASKLPRQCQTMGGCPRMSLWRAHTCLLCFMCGKLAGCLDGTCLRKRTCRRIARNRMRSAWEATESIPNPVQRFLTSKGWITEGELGFRTDPYEIPYRSMIPDAPNNLLVVCTLSATHVAYSTLRMEPVYMMIGQAAGFASALAVNNRQFVAEVPVQGIARRTTGVRRSSARDVPPAD